MDQRQNMAATAKYQVQKILFQPDTADDIDGKTFALTFTSRLNETFTTIPIAYFSDPADFHDFVLDVQRALEGLPNRVIDKVEVHGSRGSTSTHLNITFVGDNVQGPQHLITVRDILCGDGCSPKLTGLSLHPNTYNNVSEVTLSDFNSYECGRRGKCDYTSGLCTCFAGYTGLSCNVITSLV